MSFERDRSTCNKGDSAVRFTVSAFIKFFFYQRKIIVHLLVLLGAVGISEMTL